jgi:hypothetical protein
MGDRLRLVPARNCTRSGVCMSDTYMRVSPARILLDGGPSQNVAQSAIRNAGAARLGRRLLHLDSVTLAHHPCQKAAVFPACTRPPDFVSSRRSFTGFCAHSQIFSTLDARYDVVYWYLIQ